MKGIFDVSRWEALFRVSDDYLAGFTMTLKVALTGLLLALALGVIFGILSSSRSRVLKVIARIYVEFFQNTPLAIQVFCYYNCLPFLIGGRVPKFLLGVIGVGIYHGAYISEVIRTGIEGVPRGQFDAAYSQGFDYMQTMRYIILPQTMKVILPPLANQALNLVKNTSVLSMVAGLDLMYHADSWASDRGFFVQAYLACAVLYFVICFPLARLARWLEVRAKRTPVPKKQKGVA
ncbi:MAG: amino acid ABC transporter permease [Lachnospiraceae bacterium]